jgi:hypothetical protein
MSLVPERLRNLLGAAVVGAVFLAGLFIHGALGGVLLLATAIMLGIFTSAIWHRLPPARRPLRILIVVVILAVAVIKFATA